MYMLSITLGCVMNYIFFFDLLEIYVFVNQTNAIFSILTKFIPVNE